MKKIILALGLALLSFSAHAQTEKLIFAVDLIRHGDRTATIDLSTAPHHWAEGLGQLTALGMQQEYQNGVNFRQRYIEQGHLLPDQYQTQTLRVRSTDFDRTLMSAQALLLGLYPLGTGPKVTSEAALPSGFQPIPIHTESVKEDHLLAHDQHDPAFKRLTAAEVYNRSDWKEKEALLAPHYAAWSKASGLNIKDMHQLIYLGDALYILKLKGQSLPPGLSKEEINTIIDAGRFAFVTTFKPKAIGQFLGKPLLKEIAQEMQTASKNKSKLKYVLYSGHDSTILSLMSAMQAPLQDPPPYASDLNLSLYEVGSQHYLVKVRMNGKLMMLPGCGENGCTLEQFEALAN